MPVPRAARALALFASLLALATGSIAQDAKFDVTQLMRLLGAAPESEAAYTETKLSSLLAEPLASSGTLSFRRPDTVEKHMKTPRDERYRIVGGELVIARSGSERRLPLSSQPLLAAFAASLRGVLAGDAALLGRHYRLVLEGDEQAWRLDMTPLEADIARYVERIVVSGRAGRVAQVEVREASGDRSVMQVRQP